MKIAIVGYGKEGQSSYEYFSSKGDEVTVCDKNTEIVLPKDVKSQLGDSYLDNLERYDLIVRSAGINPKIILNKNPGVEAKITTQLNEFLRSCPSRRLIGITGTKGKGTTSTLIHKILSESGLKAVLCGNIGIPFLSVLEKIDKDTYVVLELSSFQLIDIKESSPHLCVCLTVVPDHLDWHDSKEEYFNAKANLFKHQGSEDLAIYYSSNEQSKQIASCSPGKLLPYFSEPGAYLYDGNVMIDAQVICQESEIKLLGKHNLQNICAAVTTSWQITKDKEAIKKVLTSFTGLEHRIEFVREFNNVRYYNDSFSTGIKATVAAIEAVEGKKLLIIGGYEKNLDISEFAYFAKENSEHFRKILLVGDSAYKLKGTLDAVNFNNYVLGKDLKSMEQIVNKASELAEPGDAVLLSPGFASFDMFRNVEDRGNQFKEAVNSLT